MIERVEISLRGRWATVPAVECDGSVLAITGTWLKLAVVHDEDFQGAAIADPERCLRALGPARADLFTFAQKITDPAPRYRYPMEWESVAAAPTTSFDAWWTSLPQETRKNVRRAARRGVAVTVRDLDDALLEDIRQLNNDSPVRQRKAFVHYGKTLDEVRKDHLPLLDRSEYICAYVERELVGFLKVAFAGPIAAIVQVLPKASHHDKRPANALVAKAIERCEARGAAYLTYGLFNQGNQGDSPLRQFKVRNGFDEIRVPRYYVALTPRGRLCRALNLHRGLIGLLPEPAIRTAVRARQAWHRWSHGEIRRCSSMAEQPSRIRLTECSKPPAGSTSDGARPAPQPLR